LARSECQGPPMRKFSNRSRERRRRRDVRCGFQAMLAVSGAVGPSVIRIRIQGLGATETAELVRFVSIRFDSELKAGSLVTIKTRKTTCHSLPIGHS
jgi:hypothetical protein